MLKLTTTNLTKGLWFLTQNLFMTLKKITVLILVNWGFSSYAIFAKTHTLSFPKKIQIILYNVKTFLKTILPEDKQYRIQQAKIWPYYYQKIFCRFSC